MSVDSLKELPTLLPCFALHHHISSQRAFPQFTDLLSTNANLDVWTCGTPSLHRYFNEFPDAVLVKNLCMFFVC